jgi:hypothetical protein
MANPIAKLKKVLQVMATSKIFARLGRSGRFARLSSGLQNHGSDVRQSMDVSSVVRETATVMVVGGAERHPRPHGNTPRGVEPSSTAADDLENPNAGFWKLSSA